MQITTVTDTPTDFVRPLDQVKIAVEDPAAAALAVVDGAHRHYATVSVEDGEATFTVSGALGTHNALLLDAEGQGLDRTTFKVDCETEIDDGGGPFSELLGILDYTMNRRGAQEMAQIDGRHYHYFVRWLRDHVHVLKGNKYFQAGLKSGVQLYLDTQCENGMVWDNVYERAPEPNWWDHNFAPEFIRIITDGWWELKRIPVEADVEYLLLEGIYYTWKATGDTAWMEAALPNAARAIEYCTTDRYRWSEKFGLVKRGYTIDTWDFQIAEDAAIYEHPMVVGPKTPFGIMHGDNTGLMAACRQMGEMLRALGRGDEAKGYDAMRRSLKDNLDKVAWNGRFYAHRIPEEPEDRGLEVDESEQISLSNAYAVNRGIDHEQCTAIIRRYMEIRDDLPPGSPGEWYAIYPWFPDGFGGHCTPGEYMNGGVLTIVAGELAHGAFEHGFEQYGADILRRVLELGRSQRGYLPCSFKGFAKGAPERTFTPLDLRGIANVDLVGDGDAPGWTGEGDNDMRNLPVGAQTFRGIDFDVIDPAANQRRACAALSINGGPCVESASVAADGRTAGSVYFLHAASRTGQVAGEYTLHYSDGTTATKYVRLGSEIAGWWQPSDTGPGRVAWRGQNPRFANVGVIAYGWDNPHPDKAIDRIEMTAARDGGILLVLAVTLCDAPAWFEPSPVSFGIPDNWGAAAVVYALVEGLAGVVDTGAALSHADLAPRWAAAGQDEVAVTVKYAESGGYVSYRYRHDAAAKALHIDVAGSGEEVECHVLLPEGAEARGVILDGEAAVFESVEVEGSRYADFHLVGGPARGVRIDYE